MRQLSPSGSSTRWSGRRLTVERWRRPSKRKHLMLAAMMVRPLKSVSLFAMLFANVASTSLAEPKPLLTIEKASGGIAFSPDGKNLAAAVPGDTWRPTNIKFWNATTGKELFLLKGHTSNIWFISFSPDGKRLATNENWHVKIWDLKTRKQLRSWQMPAFTRSVIFINDDQVAVGSDDGRIRIWDVAASRRVNVLKGHTDWVPGLALSPDGRKLASGSLDMTAKLWDLTSGKMIRSFKGHDWYVGRVSFGPQGKRLISASDDKTARIWNVETGELIRTLRGHGDWVRYVAFSRNGDWAATASNDKTARVWNASTGKAVVTIKSNEEISSAVFCPLGQRLATADRGGTIKVWDLQSLINHRRPQD